jgi:uncharacterized protein YhbP (UPF0306 family)
MELQKIIDNYLQEANIMQLATVKDGRPWLCTVTYVADDSHNLYWCSSKASRHSQELSADPAVAVAIVKDPSVKQGLQAEGVATPVAAADLETVHRLYCNRYGDKPERLVEAQSNEPHARTYYVVRLTSIKMHDEVNFPHSPQQFLSTKN